MRITSTHPTPSTAPTVASHELRDNYRHYIGLWRCVGNPAVYVLISGTGGALYVDTCSGSVQNLSSFQGEFRRCTEGEGFTITA